ncbi:sulfotransferase family 2 domain-containing protein [Paraglaciecola sp. 20A4]|uniref:sulfotransferase family 2 domain-containing protein n=1 Tax=Paraglaciecola sp. 20A4 TaxID=2687288 RepID=UPI00140E7856|nr:sulfotransferase family 2 domain-containing protein [Paraglaciecola sp. 20A4]
MLLNHRYKFLYIHIAKTGGTSIRSVLNKLRWHDPMYYLMFPCHKLSNMSGHVTGTKFPRHCGAITAKEMLPDAFFNQLYKFAFVRNPWDLQVSSYHHIQREKPALLKGIKNFNEFIEYKFDPARPYIFHFDIATKLQSEHLIDLSGNIIVDYIGRYETLIDDFSTIVQRCGMKNTPLPHKRKANGRAQDYRSYYNDDSCEAVSRHYKRDIELLNYQFE